MSKSDKVEGIVAVSDLRRTPAPDSRPGKIGKGRGRNFEAADAALREKIARDRHGSWLSGFLPENEGIAKAEWRELRAKKCECGHRGDKHFSQYFFRRRLEEHPCRACGERECLKFKEAPK